MAVTNQGRSELTTQSATGGGESRAASTRADLRVDGAHQLSTESAEIAANEMADDLFSDDDGAPARVIQHVRRQAEQLATHLRAQQRELDQREAVLNARDAQLEQQMRSARLWLNERQAELHDRQETIVEQSQQVEADRQELQMQLDSLAQEQLRIETEQRGLDVERQTEGIDAALEQHHFEQRHADLEAQQTELRRRQEAWQLAHQHFEQRAETLEEMQELLAQREIDLARRENELAAQQAHATYEEELIAQQAAVEFQSRKQQLDEAETLLTDALSDLDSNRQAVFSERKRAESDARAERRIIAEAQRATEAELHQKKESLQRRAEQLDSRQAALEQTRSDLTQLHRETLEMRLAVEETWAQLSGVAAPAVVTQTLSRIRSRLADSHRLEIEDMATQRGQMEAVGGRLHEQHEKLSAQKKEFQLWALRQREEFESHAAQLAARERDVEKTAVRCEDMQRDWLAERRKYQHEIRQLLQQLRQERELAFV